MCRSCNEPTQDKKNNAFYCNKCTTLMKRCARVWKAGNIWIWVRSNKVVRVVHKERNIEPVYVRKEVIE